MPSTVSYSCSNIPWGSTDVNATTTSLTYDMCKNCYLPNRTSVFNTWMKYIEMLEINHSVLTLTKMLMSSYWQTDTVIIFMVMLLWQLKIIYNMQRTMKLTAFCNKECRFFFLLQYHHAIYSTKIWIIIRIFVFNIQARVCVCDPLRFPAVHILLRGNPVLIIECTSEKPRDVQF